MVNKYIPKIICTECEEQNWSYEEQENTTKCTKCGALLRKQLHNIFGGFITKTKNKYILAFPDYKEREEYNSWKEMNEVLKVLNMNDKGTYIGEVSEKHRTHLDSLLIGRHLNKIILAFQPTKEECESLKDCLRIRKGKLEVNEKIITTRFYLMKTQET